MNAYTHGAQDASSIKKVLWEIVSEEAMLQWGSAKALYVYSKPIKRIQYYQGWQAGLASVKRERIQSDEIQDSLPDVVR